MAKIQATPPTPAFGVIGNSIVLSHSCRLELPIFLLISISLVLMLLYPAIDEKYYSIKETINNTR